MTTNLPVYDYGTADGSSNNNGGCNAGWTWSCIQYLSYGATPAFAYPEIYHQDGSDAGLWANISNTAGYIGFSGALSTAQACYEEDPNNPEAACPGYYNGPDQAWMQLSNSTGQSPSYEADIGFECGYGGGPTC